MPTKLLSGRTRNLLSLAFFASGFSALAYEVLWARQLALTFGTTLPAISIVTATFMGGLAIGGLFFGRRADQVIAPLRLLAFLELAIAGCALVFPQALRLVTSLYVAGSQAIPDQGLALTGLRFFLSALLLLPPTICMGGTFPLIGRYLAREQANGIIGRLYAVNTLGATTGALAGGFVLLPLLGPGATATIAMAVNFGTALVVFALSRGQAEISTHRREEPAGLLPDTRYPLLATAAIGACALAYEILWTRVFQLFLGSTVFAFSAILGAFLIGISLGGTAGALLVRRGKDLLALFILLTILMGFSVAATLPFYGRLTYLFHAAHLFADGRWWLLALLSFTITTLPVLLPAALSGALLPIVIRLLDEATEKTGTAIGWAVLANTTGTIIGSLLAGFLLIPTFGLQGSLRLVAGSNLLIGLFFLYRLPPQNPLRRAGFAIITLGGMILLAPLPWRQELLNAGVYVYPRIIAEQGGLDAYTSKFRLIEVIEGRDATVAVKKTDDGVLSLVINGKFDASTGRDMETQLLLGHLPLLLHPEPRSAMVIGLGSGITLGGTAAHPLTQLTALEISGEVIRAARHFKAENGNVLTDPRLRLIRDDARNHLLVHPDRYDIIISEPSNPWQSGNANLFTAEFYQLANSRLNETGIFCQWVPLYDISPENLRVISRTFLQTFPHAMAFLTAEGYDLILLGARQELAFNYRQLRQRLSRPEIRRSLEPIELTTPGELIGRHYLFSTAPLQRLADDARLNTDASPILEFSYPDIFRANFAANHALFPQVLGRERIPIINVGETDNEKSEALKNLANGYDRAGKSEMAAYFRGLLRKFYLGDTSGSVPKE